MVDGVWRFGAEASFVARNIMFGISQVGMPAYNDVLDRKQVGALTKFILERETSGGAEPPPLLDSVQTLDYEVKIDVWADGLATPWAIHHLDPIRALVTEKEGRLRLIENGKLHPEPISGTPTTMAAGQGGYFDVVPHPDFANNEWIYLAYSHALEDNENLEMTRIVRGKIKAGKWTSEEEIFVPRKEDFTGMRFHYGGRLAFDNQGHLFFGIGDRGTHTTVQDLTKSNGKIYRIRDNGDVPGDNPFVGQDGVDPRTFTLGNRNPQGMAFDASTGLIWASEHGPMGGDELNVVKAGGNYGWPAITYGRNYNGRAVSDLERKEEFLQPTFYWRPSIAVCGIEFCTASQFPKWTNRLLVSSLKFEDVLLLNIEGNRVIHQETILRNVGRVRDVANGPDGAIYVAVEGRGEGDSGKILRLSKIGDRKW